MLGKDWSLERQKMKELTGKHKKLEVELEELKKRFEIVVLEKTGKHFELVKLKDALKRKWWEFNDLEKRFKEMEGERSGEKKELEELKKRLNLTEYQKTVTDKELVKLKGALKEKSEQFSKCSSRNTNLIDEISKCSKNLKLAKQETEMVKKSVALKVEENQKKIVELMNTEFCCSICSEVFIRATVLSCGHTFCSFCIRIWTLTKNECPECRTEYYCTALNVSMKNFIGGVFTTLCPPDLGVERKRIIMEREAEERNAGL